MESRAQQQIERMADRHLDRLEERIGRVRGRRDRAARSLEAAEQTLVELEAERAEWMSGEGPSPGVPASRKGR